LARVLIRVGNSKERVRVNPNLENVSEPPVRATKQAAGRDLPGVVGVVGGLAHGENRRDGVAIDALRNEHVPMCVGRRDYVRIASYIGPVPGDGNVAVGFSRNPGEYIRLSGLGRV